MSEGLEDELAKASVERQAIVRKYRLGRNLENVINQWVSIASSRCIQHRLDHLKFAGGPRLWLTLQNRQVTTKTHFLRDFRMTSLFFPTRYGFIHTQTLSKEFDENEKKDKEVEIQRAAKWVKMNKNFEKFVSLNREKLHRRIHKGIPDKLRGAIWLKLLRVEHSMEDNPEMYSRMLKLAHNYSTDIRQIDNDINRRVQVQGKTTPSADESLISGAFETMSISANVTAPSSSNSSTFLPHTAATIVTLVTAKECRR